MAKEVDSDLITVQSSSVHKVSAPDSWESAPCPHCGAPQMFKVASTRYAPSIKWLRCPVCGAGSVMNKTELAPAQRPLRVPRGLPDIDATIWAEVRSCISVGATAAAVMLCRKLLFHIAVAHELPAKNDDDRAPSFYAAVEHLQSQGIITVRMRPWVDRIKDIGNDANHEVTPVSAEEANDVATFTLQLLVLAYEMDALMADPDSAVTPSTKSAVDH